MNPARFNASLSRFSGYAPEPGLTMAPPVMLPDQMENVGDYPSVTYYPHRRWERLRNTSHYPIPGTDPNGLSQILSGN